MTSQDDVKNLYNNLETVCIRTVCSIAILLAIFIFELVIVVEFFN